MGISSYALSKYELHHLEQQVVPESFEILYNGRLYDVTDFVKHHPGGNVIKFYTEFREDATRAIEDFHKGSLDQVHGILKNLKSQPANSNEYNTQSPNLTQDMAKLYLDMQRAGLFEPSYWRKAFEESLQVSRGIQKDFLHPKMNRHFSFLFFGIFFGLFIGWLVYS